jgi:hypothetical protein
VEQNPILQRNEQLFTISGTSFSHEDSNLFASGLLADTHIRRLFQSRSRFRRGGQNCLLLGHLAERTHSTMYPFFLKGE